MAKQVNDKWKWQLVEGDDNGDIYVQADKDHVIPFGNLEGSCEKCHRYARLTAAAPEMLDILLRCEIQLEYLQGKFGSTGTGNQTLAQIRAVIEKATQE